jgi:hypothetical protein
MSKKTFASPRSHETSMSDDPGVYVSQLCADPGRSIRPHDQATPLEASNLRPFPVQSAKSVRYNKDVPSANELSITTKRKSSVKQMESWPLEEVKRRTRPANKQINGSRQQVFKGSQFQATYKEGRCSAGIRETNLCPMQSQENSRE